MLKDDKQWHVAMTENSQHAMPQQLRELFVHILSNTQVAEPLRLWDKHWPSMSDDFLHSRRQATHNKSLQLGDDELQNLALTGLYIL